jgi:uncharacterized membrane protein
MESKAKLLGHPIHPMLIVLPLGLFIAAVVFDAVYLWRGSPAFATAAYWNIAAGIVGGLLAAVFGAIDWFAIPAGQRARRVEMCPVINANAKSIDQLAAKPSCDTAQRERHDFRAHGIWRRRQRTVG